MTNTTLSPVRVLPKDVYDTIEFAALANGGIGANADYELLVGSDDDLTEVERPCCVHGLAKEAGTDANRFINWEINAALYAVDIYRRTNDRAVRDINVRRERPADTRVTFKQWAKELNVERGDV